MDIATATDMSSGRGASVRGYLVLTMTDAGRGGRTGRSLKVGGGSGSGRVEGGPPTWDGGWRGTMGLGRWTKGMPRSSPARTGTGMGTGKEGQARHGCRRGNYLYRRSAIFLTAHGGKIKSRLCEPRPRIRQPPRAGSGSGSSRQRQTSAGWGIIPRGSESAGPLLHLSIISLPPRVSITASTKMSSASRAVIRPARRASE